MDYEDEARDVVRKWINQYLLEDMPRDYDTVLIQDIAHAIEEERHGCARVIHDWIEYLQSHSSMMNTDDILNVIHNDILMRGHNGQDELPTLRESASSPSWT